MKLNKHTKLAIIIAPFLAIGGYIAAGYYSDAQMNKERFLNLVQEGTCQLQQGDCKLHNGAFQINLAQKDAGIHLTTTHPIDHAVISLVDVSNHKEKLYPLKQTTNRGNWLLAAHAFQQVKSEKIRVLITISKTSYLAEIMVNVN